MTSSRPRRLILVAIGQVSHRLPSRLGNQSQHTHRALPPHHSTIPASGLQPPVYGLPRPFTLLWGGQKTLDIQTAICILVHIYVRIELFGNSFDSWFGFPDPPSPAVRDTLLLSQKGQKIECKVRKVRKVQKSSPVDLFRTCEPSLTHRFLPRFLCLFVFFVAILLQFELLTTHPRLAKRGILVPYHTFTRHVPCPFAIALLTCSLQSAAFSLPPPLF